MVAFLYRWRLLPGQEDAFVEAWSQVTAALWRQGSLGSRLHRGSDGIWYSYAQWPSAEARAEAFTQELEPAASARMRAAIAESFDEVRLEIADDQLVAWPSEGV